MWRCWALKRWLVHCGGDGLFDESCVGGGVKKVQVGSSIVESGSDSMENGLDVGCEGTRGIKDGLGVWTGATRQVMLPFKEMGETGERRRERERVCVCVCGRESGALSWYMII